jgi:ATP-dependent helicase YprA (DUF1998 family)
LIIPENVARPVETDVDSEGDRRFFPRYKTTEGKWENIRHNNPTFGVTSVNWYFTRGAAKACCTRFKKKVERSTRN